MNKTILSKIGIGILVYAVASVASYFIFSPLVSSQSSSPILNPSTGANGQLVFDSKLPKTEVCPLNGAMYSKQQRDWWEKHRPLGIMIENHENSRPQSGISSADVVYEAIAEGGITRFLLMFYCQNGGQVGPVRSARTYFLDFVSEYGDHPLYTHVGGANQPGLADALGQIGDYGWDGYNDMNQFSIGYPVFWRDYDRLGHATDTEHTMYSTTDKLWKYAESNRKLSSKDKDGTPWNKGFISYVFKEDLAKSSRPASQKIHLEFWSGNSQYYVDWAYDPINNNYLRSNGGKPHLDKNNNKQLNAKTVVVLSMLQSYANDGYEGNVHLLFKDKGTGKATVFMDGKKISATWKKDRRISRLKLFDASGDEIKLNRGLIWFEILPTDGVVDVK